QRRGAGGLAGRDRWQQSTPPRLPRAAAGPLVRRFATGPLAPGRRSLSHRMETHSAMKISVVPADIAELLPRLAKGQAATWRMDFGGEATDWHTLDHPVHEQPQRGGRWGWYKRSRTLLVPLH